MGLDWRLKFRKQAILKGFYEQNMLKKSRVVFPSFTTIQPKQSRVENFNPKIFGHNLFDPDGVVDHNITTFSNNGLTPVGSELACESEKEKIKRIKSLHILPPPMRARWSVRARIDVGVPIDFWDPPPFPPPERES